MIYDLLDQSAVYAPLHPLLAEAFAALRSFDPATPEGRIELRGQDLFLNVERYVTQPADQRRYEAHRRYLDVQTIFAGEEAIDCVLLPEARETEAYDAERDVAFYQAQEPSRLALRPGRFAIFLPQHVHRPVCQLAGPSEVTKVVAKVLLDAR